MAVDLVFKTWNAQHTVATIADFRVLLSGQLEMGQPDREASATIVAIYMSEMENCHPGRIGFSKDMGQGNGAEHGRKFGLELSGVITKDCSDISLVYSSIGTGVSR